MQVEQYEINGFVIDQFNQYNLEQKKQGICRRNHNLLLSFRSRKIRNSLEW